MANPNAANPIVAPVPLLEPENDVHAIHNPSNESSGIQNYYDNPNVSSGIDNLHENPNRPLFVNTGNPRHNHAAGQGGYHTIISMKRKKGKKTRKSKKGKKTMRHRRRSHCFRK